MSYSAIVARVHTRPHPNADRLQIGTCAGHQVVVGLDTQDGELGVFFPCDGQLSEPMVRANNLYSKSALDKLGIAYEPDQKFGFFSEKRRVRSQAFRGVKSDGFWVPLTYFTWTDAVIDIMSDPPPGMDEFLLLGLNEGDEFTTLKGHEICCKYETPATRRAREQGTIGRKQRENRCFPKHDVTKKFKYVANSIPAGAVLYLTEKLHGTSGRFGRVLDDVEVPWWKALVNLCWPGTFAEREYRYLNGSKNVILEKTTGEGYYGTNEFRHAAIKDVTLHKGEILYYELVGFVDDHRGIMGAQPITAEIRKHYENDPLLRGSLMDYRYGCAPGQCDLYVYRIVRMNEDGNGIDLSWPQVKQRCAELGLKTVPEVATGGCVFDGDISALTTVVEDLAGDGEHAMESTLDVSHIREGVVLRVESAFGTEFIKHKSWLFGVLEGYIKDVDTYVDTEEVA